MSQAIQVRGRRSKGCATCRKRRVKCDEKRPACDRCVRGFHVCLGYDTAPIFIFSDQRTENRTSRNQALPSVGRSAGPVAGNHSIQSQIGSLSHGVPENLNLVAFSQDIVLSYMAASLSGQSPGGPRVPEITDLESDAPTIWTILSQQNRESPVFICGLSSAEALFGHMHGDKTMVHHSSNLYSQALQKFQHDIGTLRPNRDRAQHYAALWSCLFLEIYELLLGLGPINWVHHSRGIAALTQSAGPAAFQSPKARELFNVLRTFIVPGAVARRKRSFLDEDGWRTVPWGKDPNAKTTGNKLQDLFCQVPGLLEDGDKMRTFPSTNSHRELQERVSHTFDELFRLQHDWMQENTNSCWETPTDQINSVWVSNNNEALFRRVLWFETFILGMEATHFLVVWLLLYGLCKSASLDVPILVEDPQEMPCPLLRLGAATPQEHATELCRIVDFMFLGEDGHRGPMSILFPLKIASRYLTNSPELSQCLKKIFHQISTDRGFGVSDKVLGMEIRDFQL